MFRKAMEGIIPDFILNRPKLGFPVPLREWLKGAPADGILESIKGSGIDSYVNMQTVERMMKLHKDGAGDYARRIWVLYVFAMWHMTYMQTETQKAAFAAV